MATYTKNYIGKGKQVNELDIVKVSIPLEKAMKATYEKDGVTYISFEIAKMQNPDNFGRTHTCYYQTKETAQVNEPTAKRSRGKGKKQKTEYIDLPF